MFVVCTYVEGVEDPIHKTLAADEADTWRAKDRAEAAIARHMIYAGRPIRHEVLPVRTVTVPVGLTLEAICAEAIKATIEECGGNKTEAARILGVSRGTISNYIGTRSYRRKTRGRGRRRAERIGAVA